MKLYTVTFWKQGRRVCSCVKEGKDADDAMLNAGFALLFQHPDVEYDDVTASEAATD